MPKSRWQDVLARVTRNDAANLDDILRHHDPRAREPGADILPDGVGLIPFAPEFRKGDTVAIGVRVQEPREDAADFAAHLAAFAIERDVEIVVLSHQDYSGLERFGFRTERIAGGTEEARAVCERQVASFWNLEVIV